MSDLQTTFYVIGIIFMSLMLLVSIIAVVAIIVIRNKINAIHRQIETKLGQVTEWAEKGGALLGVLKKVTHHHKK